MGKRDNNWAGLNFSPKQASGSPLAPHLPLPPHLGSPPRFLPPRRRRRRRTPKTSPPSGRTGAPLAVSPTSSTRVLGSIPLRPARALIFDFSTLHLQCRSAALFSSLTGGEAMAPRSKKRSRRRGSPEARLTDDLLVEILRRLPAKSLCACKCVHALARPHLRSGPPQEAAPDAHRLLLHEPQHRPLPEGSSPFHQRLEGRRPFHQPFPAIPTLALPRVPPHLGLLQRPPPRPHPELHCSSDI